MRRGRCSTICIQILVEMQDESPKSESSVVVVVVVENEVEDEVEVDEADTMPRLSRLLD